MEVPKPAVGANCSMSGRCRVQLYLQCWQVSGARASARFGATTTVLRPFRPSVFAIAEGGTRWKCHSAQGGSANHGQQTWQSPLFGRNLILAVGISNLHRSRVLSDRSSEAGRRRPVSWRARVDRRFKEYMFPHWFGGRSVDCRPGQPDLVGRCE